MNAQEIRQKYLDFFAARDHVVMPRAKLVPDNDPTTLFTGSGMQPLLPYLLGQEHPLGTRLVDSQTCLRAQDIEEVGDNRHTTFFEMLGNWSLGEYFKAEQIPWFWEFLTREIGLDPSRIYVSCFIGDEQNNIPRDQISADVWAGLFAQAELDSEMIDLDTEENGARIGGQDKRISFYGNKNWWARNGMVPATMTPGEPGGPDTEMFYLFPDVEHDTAYGEKCHVNCDCGRYIELGNSVFMEYLKTENGFEKLPKQNVDYGGGLERIAAAAIDSPDVYRISIMWPIIEKLELVSGKKYQDHTTAMRVITDHLRAATFLAVDGVIPSNKEQGYVMRRLLRRAIRFAFELGVDQNFLEEIVPVIADLYHEDFPEVAEKRDEVIAVVVKEEKVFRQTLRKGLKMLEKAFSPLQSTGASSATADEAEEGGLPRSEAVTSEKGKDSQRLSARQSAEQAVLADAQLRGRGTGLAPSHNSMSDAADTGAGAILFMLYDTYGFPVELSVEECQKRGIALPDNWRDEFEIKMSEQRQKSQTAQKGVFRGGLGGDSLQHRKYHTATHLMYQALRDVLGDHVVQHGSNITEERLRFDFSHPEKMTDEQKQRVEDIVNDQIGRDLKVSYAEYPTAEATGPLGALGQFGDRYGDKVKVYKMIADNADKPYSFEICGGPHVDHTLQLIEDGKRFKILKEESSSAGIRRIKAVLV